jgi:hypothetical protein
MTESSSYSHPRCYGSADGMCSSKISREHFFSQSLLRRLTTTSAIEVAGLKWQKPDTLSPVPIDGFASNILCTYHNSLLHDLDTEVVQFVQAIHDIDQRGAAAPKVVTCSGPLLERWMLKCLLGATVSKNISGRLKPECVDILFNRVSWPPNWGLYFQGPALFGKRTVAYHTNSLMIETKVNKSGVVPIAYIALQGMPLWLLMGRLDSPLSLGTWRPSEIKFRQGDITRKVRLRWRGPHGGPIDLRQVGKRGNGIPPDWPDWAQRSSEREPASKKEPPRQP